MPETSLEDVFVGARPRLVRMAYRMMGTLDDAEDVVQDVYLRVESSDPQGVANWEAYLVRAVVRSCLDRWKSAHTRRMQYVGPWLPEPVVEPRIAGGAADAELAESLSFALLVLLETLDPVQRAVYLLHDVFGYEFAEIAELVGKSVENCRQIARRARERLASGPGRFETQAEEHERLVIDFMAACRSGDVTELAELLAEDVRSYSDGGGKVAAARAPVVGRDRVVRFILGLRTKAARLGLDVDDWEVRVNGEPGIVSLVNGEPHVVIALDIAEGRITELYCVLNPDKLRTCRETVRRVKEDRSC